MISSLKKLAVAFGIVDHIRSKSGAPRPKLAILPSIPTVKNPNLSFSSWKPLYLASPEGFGFCSYDGILFIAKPRGLRFKHEAYKADSSENAEIFHQETHSGRLPACRHHRLLHYSHPEASPLPDLPEPLAVAAFLVAGCHRFPSPPPSILS